MRLLISGRGASRACAWESYALLRDNIQHFVEGGSPSGRFSALHSLARAVDEGSCTVDAVRLRLEALHIWTALGNVLLEDAAISSRTEAVSAGNSLAPSLSQTKVASQGGLAVPVSAPVGTPLPQAARDFVEAVLAVTAAAAAGDQLEVRRLDQDEVHG